MSAEKLFQKYSDEIEVRAWWYESSTKDYFPANLEAMFPRQMLEDYRNIHKFEGTFPDGKKFLEDTNFINNIKKSPKHQEKMGPQELSILDYITPEMNLEWKRWNQKKVKLSIHED